jgi:L-fucose mutarotase
MLFSNLLHPEILQVLGAAGHGSTILIADGNYPASTCLGPKARLVSLNLSPGIVNCLDVLRAVASSIPIESASVMQPAEGSSPPIWSDFQEILGSAGFSEPLQRIERFAFYQAASTSGHALTIQTAEQRVYANLLLTIGVRRS